MRPSNAVLHCANADHVLNLRIAGTFFSRLRGLMLAAPLELGHGMLLLGCTSIHTGFMRQTIDVVYLDGFGVITGCVAYLKAWRLSHAGGVGGSVVAGTGPRHTLELAAGSIAELKIVPGDSLSCAAWASGDLLRRELPPGAGRLDQRMARQKGSAMIEFAVVGPIITLFGLATLQYGMLFFAKNQYNHASFMAARAGTTGNANFSKIEDAYARALIPLYAQGTSSALLLQAFDAAKTEVATNASIEVLNPTTESFADFNDDALQKEHGIGGATPRVIPNGGLAFRHASVVRPSSGQNIQDANLLKLRITHGFKLKVPLMGLIYSKYLLWLDTGTSAFNTAMIKDQRVPVVTYVTLQMQSDAIEDKTVSSSGAGNGGTPANPGDPPVVTTTPPECLTIGCTVAPNHPTSGEPGAGAHPGDGTTPGGSCPQP